MNAEELYNFRTDLQKQGIVFCYSGFMTEQILTGIAQALKSKMAIEETDKQVAKGVFSILVEQVQNVIRYSAEYDPPDDATSELRYGVLIVGKINELFHVTCGNLIRIQDVERLGENLSEVQAMDKDELKAKYKETLKGETPEGSKGAGVGFLDIARRARHGFEFDFHPVNGYHSYFSFIAYM